MYIFNHIPKCGGLSYRALLEEIFGKEKVTHITINLEQEYQLDPNDYRQYPLLMGHFGVRWNEIVGPGRRWMTVLRDPIDRVVSTYYFWRHNATISPESPWLYMAQTKSLEGFVRSGHYLVRQGVENLQTWQLADDLRWRYHSVSERDALDVAKENLGRFSFIGLHEEMAPSIEKMCRFLGVAPPTSVPHVNATKTRHAVSEIHRSSIDAIAELNRADLELYAYARKIFDGRTPVPPSRIPGRSGAELSMLPASVDEAKALRLRIIEMPSEFACRDVIEAVVEVFNDGSRAWSSGRPNPMFVSYHWFDEAGEPVVHDGWRSEIRPVLQAFSFERFRVHIVVPSQPGSYRLRLTLVQ